MEKQVDSVYIGEKICYGESVMLRVMRDKEYKDFVNMSLGRYVMKDFGEIDAIQPYYMDVVVGVYTNYKTNDSIIISTSKDGCVTTVFRYIKEDDNGSETN